jgi:hypothetical protein
MESGKVPLENLIGFSVFLQDIDVKIRNAVKPAEDKYVKSFFIFIDEVADAKRKRVRNNKIIAEKNIK